VRGGDGMSDPKAQQEPSMEEILASIRRIISEDTEGAKGPAAMPSPPSTRSATALGPVDDDVLNLTEKLNEDGSTINLNRQKTRFDPEPEPPASSMAAFNLDAMYDENEDDMRFDPPKTGDTLLSRSSTVSSASAFAALSDFHDPEPAPQSRSMPSGDGLTVEELVRETLKPILKDWLDRNLPPMVEDLVRAEIERVASAGRRR
jgi:cell pole-organizing protein PopZ